MEILVTNPCSGMGVTIVLLPTDSFDIFRQRVFKELDLTDCDLIFAGDVLCENNFPGCLCSGSEIEVQLSEQAQSVLALKLLGIHNPSANILLEHIDSKKLDAIPLLIKAGTAQRGHIIAACEGNLVEVVRMLIDLDLPRPRFQLSKALIVSVVREYRDITRLLVKKDVDASAAFRSAAMKDDHEAVQLLFSNCVIKDFDLLISLHDCATNGLLDMCKYILPILRKRKASMSTKPLLQAIRGGFADITSFFIDSGIPLEEAEEQSSLPLAVAVGYGKCEIAELLLDKGVDGKSETYKDLLIRAVGTGLPEIVNFVLSKCNTSGIERAFAALDIAPPGDNASVIVNELLDFVVKNEIKMSEEVAPFAFAVYKNMGISTIKKLIKVFGSKCNEWNSSHRCDTLTMACQSKRGPVDLEVVEFLISQGGGDGSVPYSQFAASNNDPSRTSPIIAAVIGGRFDILELIFKSHPKPNYIDTPTQDGKTALSISAADGNIEMIKLLLQNGSSLTSNNRHHNPLTTAIRKKKLEATKLLLSAGGCVSTIKLTDFAFTSPDILQLLIDSHGKDKQGRPAICPKVLVKAVYENKETNVELFLKNGVDPNRRGEESYNALYPMQIVSGTGNYAIAKLLIEFGAVVDARTAKLPTALSIAASEGNANIVDLLIKHGADPNAKKGKATALFRAAKRGHTAVVEVLIQDKRVNVDSATMLGKTPFSSACCKGFTEIVQLLLSVNVDINKSCIEGFTPLERAVTAGYDEIVTLLLDRNALVNSQADVISCYYKRYREAIRMVGVPVPVVHPGFYLKMMRRLLEKGANPNIKNSLHEATIDGEDTVVKLLLDFKADTSLRNNFGLTPLHLASSRGRISIALLLLSRGADPFITFEEKSALELADKELDSEMINILTKAEIHSTHKETDRCLSKRTSAEDDIELKRPKIDQQPDSPTKATSLSNNDSDNT